MIRKRFAVVTAVVTAAAVSASVALAATTTVKVGDNYFVKKSGVPTVTVKKGTTVKWVWKGKAPHNVTVKSGPAKFASKTQTKGSFSKKLSKKGTYLIICTIHGQGDQSMKLKVK